MVTISLSTSCLSLSLVGSSVAVINPRGSTTSRTSERAAAMWWFLLGFGAIFAGYAIFIGPLGRKRDGACGSRRIEKENAELYRLCQRQQDLFYGDGVSLLTNVLSEEELLEIEKMFEQYNESPSFDEIVALPPSASASLGFNISRKIIQSFASQLWKEISMVVSPSLIPPSLLQDIDVEGFVTIGPLASLPWHQDLAYWPSANVTPDTRTIIATISLDNSTQAAGGGFSYVANTGRVKRLREHSYSVTSRTDYLNTSVNTQIERIKSIQVTRFSLSPPSLSPLAADLSGTSDSPKRVCRSSF
jgi:hypothetical protein